MVEKHILNLGAGVQSTALYLLACAGEYSFDAAVFADTQEEPAAVYAHLDWLRTQGGPPILTSTAGRLGDDLKAGKNADGNRMKAGGRFVSIPAFTLDDEGKLGKVKRQCTKEYKIEVVDRVIRREVLGLAPRKWIPRDTTIYQYFGISTDEAARAERAKKRFEKVRHTKPRYPLIERGWSRLDCLAYLKDRVPHPVPKSACVFCPYHTNDQWADIKANDPDGWARAVEVDEALRSEESAFTRRFRQKMYLHRSGLPLVQIDFGGLTRETLDPMATNECHGMCGV